MNTKALPMMPRFSDLTDFVMLWCDLYYLANVAAGCPVKDSANNSTIPLDTIVNVS